MVQMEVTRARLPVVAAELCMDRSIFHSKTSAFGFDRIWFPSNHINKYCSPTFPSLHHVHQSVTCPKDNWWMTKYTYHHLPEIVDKERDWRGRCRLSICRSIESRWHSISFAFRLQSDTEGRVTEQLRNDILCGQHLDIYENRPGDDHHTENCVAWVTFTFLFDLLVKGGGVQEKIV